MNSAQLVSTFVAGLAAILAATLSAITLWATGRREERKWRREALLDTIVHFLDGSFDLPGNRLYNRLLLGQPLEDDVRERSAAAFRRSASALTRLRIIATAPLVTAAERVHDIDDRVMASLFEANSPPSVQDWVELADERRLARTAFLHAARKALDLDQAKPLEPTRHRPLLEGA